VIATIILEYVLRRKYVRVIRLHAAETGVSLREAPERFCLSDVHSVVQLSVERRSKTRLLPSPSP
jgi:hypothetical protein